MSQNINILIVDDHPFIIIGYQNAITRFPNKKYSFTITKASDCKTGYEAIMNPEGTVFDIALLDISMPVYEEKNMQTGEDLAKLLKQVSPDCKTVILTMHSEGLKVQKVIEEIDPLGLIIKNDLTYDNMILALTTILKGELRSPCFKTLQSTNLALSMFCGLITSGINSRFIRPCIFIV